MGDGSNLMDADDIDAAKTEVMTFAATWTLRVSTRLCSSQDVALVYLAILVPILLTVSCATSTDCF